MRITRQKSETVTLDYEATQRALREGTIPVGTTVGFTTVYGTVPPGTGTIASMAGMSGGDIFKHYVDWINPRTGRHLGNGNIRSLTYTRNTPESIDIPDPAPGVEYTPEQMMLIVECGLLDPSQEWWVAFKHIPGLAWEFRGVLQGKTMRQRTIDGDLVHRMGPHGGEYAATWIKILGPVVYRESTREYTHEEIPGLLRGGTLAVGTEVEYTTVFMARPAPFMQGTIDKNRDSNNNDLFPFTVSGMYPSNVRKLRVKTRTPDYAAIPEMPPRTINGYTEGQTLVGTDVSRVFRTAGVPEGTRVVYTRDGRKTGRGTLVDNSPNFMYPIRVNADDGGEYWDSITVLTIEKFPDSAFSKAA